MRWQSAVCVAMLLGLVGGAARAGDTAAGTPQAALHRIDDLSRGRKLDQVAACYQTDNPSQQELAAALAAVNVALARVEVAVEARFGKDVGDQVVRALDGKTSADIDEADVQVEQDKATVRWKNGLPALPMVRVGGDWKIALGPALKDAPDLARQSEAMRRLAADLTTVAEKVETDQFRSGRGVVDRVAELREGMQQ